MVYIPPKKTTKPRAKVSKAGQYKIWRPPGPLVQKPSETMQPRRTEPPSSGIFSSNSSQPTSSQYVTPDEAPDKAPGTPQRPNEDNSEGSQSVRRSGRARGENSEQHQRYLAAIVSQKPTELTPKRPASGSPSPTHCPRPSQNHWKQKQLRLLRI